MEKVLFKTMDQADFRTMRIWRRQIARLQSMDQTTYGDALKREQRKLRKFMATFYPDA